MFAHDIHDIIPQKSYAPAKEWTDMALAREFSYLIRHYSNADKISSRWPLPPLQVGSHVYVQDLSGPPPHKWNKSAVVLECLPYDSYLVKLDGSNRVSKRNRVHLRCFTPFSSTFQEDQAVKHHTSPPPTIPEDALDPTPRRMPHLADTADEPRSPSLELHTYPEIYLSSVSSMSYPRCLCTVPSLLEDLPLTVAAAVMSLSNPEAPNQLPTWRSDTEGASLQHSSAEVWHPQPNQSG